MANSRHHTSVNYQVAYTFTAGSCKISVASCDRIVFISKALTISRLKKWFLTELSVECSGMNILASWLFDELSPLTAVRNRLSWKFPSNEMNAMSGFESFPKHRLHKEEREIWDCKHSKALEDPRLMRMELNWSRKSCPISTAGWLWRQGRIVTRDMSTSISSSYVGLKVDVCSWGGSVDIFWSFGTSYGFSSYWSASSHILLIIAETSK